MGRTNKIIFLDLIMVFLTFFLLGCQSNKKNDEHKDMSSTDMPQMDMPNKEVKKQNTPEMARSDKGMGSMDMSNKEIKNSTMQGMDMSKKDTKEGDKRQRDINNNDSNFTLTKPTNEFVLSSIPTTTISISEVSPIINALGRIAYDTRQIGVISSKVAGRIDRLYVQYRYQKISKGQKIMDIYSPELLTVEENLLFLLKNDPDNSSLINATKERLQLLGMGTEQVLTMINTHKTINAITIYSNYEGHIHESGMANNSMSSNTGAMKDLSLTTEPLAIKEGMYIQKGQELFSVYNPGKVWILLNIYTDNIETIKVGNEANIVCETAPNKDFNGKIDFIEPFFRKENKTITARISFNNSKLQIPIGSQVKAAISTNKKTISTLPVSTVVSLGIDKIVFRKVKEGFRAQKVIVGDTYKDRIQIISGLTVQDSVAINAQFLMDSESFIKVNK